MVKVLHIAGHGLNKNNGYFDSGATGFITKGEHKYYVENFFPTMRKYMTDEDLKNSIFHTEYNVYSHNNLVSLVKSHGADVVIEWHYDSSSNSSAKGGHVIVYSDFKADTLDLKIRDVIKKNIGLAYPKHFGELGISGRNDLRNVNVAAKGGINYRLIELGFGSNRTDSNKMLDYVETIAKDMVNAIYGQTRNGSVSDKLYRVQVGAYREQKNAVNKLEELKKQGHDVYIVRY